MNLVGKILTVLVVVAALVFASLTVAVYATHKNWRDIVMNTEAGPGKALGLQLQLKQAQEKNAALKDAQAKLAQELEAEKVTKRNELTKLEQKVKELADERERLDKEKAALDEAQRNAVAAMQASQQSLGGLRKEIEGLRDEVRSVRKDRDDQFKAVVKKTDELHQAVNEAKRLRDRTEVLAKDLGRAQTLLQKNGLDMERDGKPFPVEGLVTAVHGSDLIEISIGADDGLSRGNQLEVFRIDGNNSTYLGRAEIVRVEPDRAVGRLDPKFRRGMIQKDDRVATKIE
jgi:septal ring factor EnvC (AmiA/AmiB activator)